MHMHTWVGKWESKFAGKNNSFSFIDIFDKES